MKDNTEQTIEFFEADIEYQLDRPDDIRLWLTNLAIEEKCGIEKIQYIFCTDEYLLGINKQYLEHDYYTDIITFPINNSKTAIKSDIYISVDRVIENAKSYGVSTIQEFYRVIAHGLLHLCGYDDATDDEKRIMRERENYYLDKVL
ncbi:rRNA maturation RNase YbeY [Saprospiraceae bacterium]|nr:rRNA maturation RNase YbeY [Saprospiraceae bacterium]